jgi:hypothetical protein
MANFRFILALSSPAQVLIFSLDDLNRDDVFELGIVTPPDGVVLRMIGFKYQILKQ